MWIVSRGKKTMKAKKVMKTNAKRSCIEPPFMLLLLLSLVQPCLLYLTAILWDSSSKYFPEMLPEIFWSGGTGSRMSNPLYENLHSVTDSPSILNKAWNAAKQEVGKSISGAFVCKFYKSRIHLLLSCLQQKILRIFEKNLRKFSSRSSPRGEV